ncbi:hypothetical protein [Tumebacillus lipolyticus]|uniref:Uncharacterized protein n=1 Tax=Tumebacillus lipolyticus TaxID=1280370 RepID=A0ABW4ZRC2_9BACL
MGKGIRLPTSERRKSRGNSWSRGKGEPGLIGRKKVDWSIFEEGTTIPQNVVQFFSRANDGRMPERGEVFYITLVVDEKEYKAELHNKKRQGSDLTQIRYDSNKELRQVFLEQFQRSYAYIKPERERLLAMGRKPSVVVPDPIAEYLEFHETTGPFRYHVELVHFGGTLPSESKCSRKIRSVDWRSARCEIK